MAYAATTIPVGTAMIPYPQSIIMEASIFPIGVSGVMSPYPTVVIVTIVRYKLVGISVNQFCGHSMIYINEANITERIRINERNMMIFGKLLLTDLTRTISSCRKSKRLRILNTLKNLNVLKRVK